MEFPSHILHQQLSICHKETLNAVADSKVWAPIFTKQLVHLFADNTTAVAIFQAERGRDTFINACAKEIWLTCTAWDGSLAVEHVSGASLLDTAGLLSCWHMDQQYQAKVAFCFLLTIYKW